MTDVIMANHSFSFLDFRFDGGEKVKLLAEFTYVAADGRTIIVPKGFETDGATIPRFLWPIYGHPFYKKNIRAATGSYPRRSGTAQSGRHTRGRNETDAYD